MPHAAPPPRFSPASRGRLTAHDLGRFPSSSLFDRLGRAICGAGCLPRKELYEAWEVARRARRLFRGGRVVDLAAGHALLGQIMLLLDDTSPDTLAVDPTPPLSLDAVHEALAREWPRLTGRLRVVRDSITAVSLTPDDVVVSSHPCGDLTDAVIARAIEARARVAVLPCCHHLITSPGRDLRGWLDGPLAADVARAEHLREHGYRIWTQTIPSAITPKNRLLLAAPLSHALRGR